MVPQPKDEPFHLGDFSQVVGRDIDQRLVQFVVPDMNRDLERGIYPTLTLADRHNNPLVRKIDRTVKDYLLYVQQLAKAVRGGSLTARTEFNRIVVIPERPEFRFGYTRRGHKGCIVRDGEIQARLQERLIRYPAFLDVLPNLPDAMHLLPELDMDRVSDLFLSVALRDTIVLTQYYAGQYGFQPSCVQSVMLRDAWNPSTLGFDAIIPAKTPVDQNGQPILLLDKRMVRGTAAIAAGDYIKYGRNGAEYDAPSISKHQILEIYGHDAEGLEQFVRERLEEIQAHRAFQEGPAKRRKRR